ncbi:MAG: GAP family protein [Acetobacterium woodii]|nr:GAP family protein [Acetobacterium woodii]
MERTFLEILPLAIGAAISPTGLLFVMLILSGKDNSKKSALGFVLGSTLFLALLGLIIFFTAKPVVNSTNHPNITSSIIDIVLGILILAIVAKSVFFKKKPKTDDPKKKKRPYPIMGFLYMCINISTLIPFIAAVKIISMNKLAPWDGLAILLVTILITMSMIAFPVLITYAMPHESQKILGPVNGFMAKNGAKIGNIYFALMALYLIYHGVMGILKIV